MRRSSTTIMQIATLGLALLVPGAVSAHDVGGGGHGVSSVDGLYGARRGSSWGHVTLGVQSALGSAHGLAGFAYGWRLGGDPTSGQYGLRSFGLGHGPSGGRSYLQRFLYLYRLVGFPHLDLRWGYSNPGFGYFGYGNPGYGYAHPFGQVGVPYGW